MDLEFPNGIALDFHVKSTRCDESMTWSRDIALHSFTDCEIRGSVQLHRQRLRETCGHVLHNQDRNWNFCGKDGKNLAVKIQYPGVAESISSDLAMVKPIAIKMFNIKGKDSDKYFKEVEDKLIEETNYLIEIKHSQEISKACKHIPNLYFPKYYEEFYSPF